MKLAATFIAPWMLCVLGTGCKQQAFSEPVRESATAEVDGTWRLAEFNLRGIDRTDEIGSRLMRIKRGRAQVVIPAVSKGESGNGDSRPYEEQTERPNEIALQIQIQLNQESSLHGEAQLHLLGTVRDESPPNIATDESAWPARWQREAYKLTVCVSLDQAAPPAQHLPGPQNLWLVFTEANDQPPPAARAKEFPATGDLAQFEFSFLRPPEAATPGNARESLNASESLVVWPTDPHVDVEQFGPLLRLPAGQPGKTPTPTSEPLVRDQDLVQRPLSEAELKQVLAHLAKRVVEEKLQGAVTVKSVRITPAYSSADRGAAIVAGTVAISTRNPLEKVEKNWAVRFAESFGFWRPQSETVSRAPSTLAELADVIHDPRQLPDSMQYADLIKKAKRQSFAEVEQTIKRLQSQRSESSSERDAVALLQQFQQWRAAISFVRAMNR